MTIVSHPLQSLYGGLMGRRTRARQRAAHAVYRWRPQRCSGELQPGRVAWRGQGWGRSPPFPAPLQPSWPLCFAWQQACSLSGLGPTPSGLNNIDPGVRLARRTSLTQGIFADTPDCSASPTPARETRGSGWRSIESLVGAQGAHGR